MKTIIFLIMIFISSSLLSQIPDFNSSEKTKNRDKNDIKSLNDTTSIVYNNKYAVKIREDLLLDMKSLFNINDEYIDATAAFKYLKISRYKLDSLERSRSLTFIEGDPDGVKNKDAIYINSNLYNTTMLEKSDYKERIIKLQDFFKTANALGGTPNLIRGIFPIKSISQGKYFFLDNNDEKSVMFINKVGLQSNFSSAYTANASLITGIIPVKFMPLKFTMATNITQQTSENDSIAANKLNNGGLFNLSVQYPVYFHKWNVEKGKNVIFYLPVEYRFNIDDIRDKIAISESYFYHEFSGYLMTTIDLIQHIDDENPATIFGAIKASYFTGGSQFQNKLSDNNFWLYQLSLGILIKEKFTISANIPLNKNTSIIGNQQIANFGITFQPNK